MARNAEEELEALRKWFDATVTPGVWTWIGDSSDDGTRDWVIEAARRCVGAVRRVSGRLDETSFSTTRYDDAFARDAYGSLLRPIGQLAELFDIGPKRARSAIGAVLRQLDADVAEQLVPFGFTLNESARALYLHNADDAHLMAEDLARELALWAIEAQWQLREGRLDQRFLNNVTVGSDLLLTMVAHGEVAIDNHDVVAALEPTLATFDATYKRNGELTIALRQRIAELRTDPIEQTNELVLFSPGGELTQFPTDTRSERQRLLDAALEEIDGLVGLEEVKAALHEFVESAVGREHRRAAGLPAAPPAPGHFLLLGAPGTGKTTVANLIAHVQFGLGLLPTSETVEPQDRSEIIGEFVGHTAPLVRKLLERARGKVLFIDEAYALDPGGKRSNDFAREALAVIVKHMEENRDSFSLVLAGYEEPMEDLLRANDGLRSRISNVWHFSDLNFDQTQILWDRLMAEDHYVLTDAARDYLFGLLFVERSNPGFANARTVRNLYEHTVRKQNARIGRLTALPTRDELITIDVDDLPPVAELRTDSSRGRDRGSGERGFDDR